MRVERKTRPRALIFSTGFWKYENNNLRKIGLLYPLLEQTRLNRKNSKSLTDPALATRKLFCIEHFPQKTASISEMENGN